MNKVMLIDDDVFMTRLFSTLLQSDGFQVTIVNKGEEAFKQIKSVKPDVVVLDLHMPGVNGVEVFKRIRGSAELKDLPVIVYSNGYIKALIDEAKDLNPHKILSKLHYTPKKLINEIKGTLASRSDTAKGD